MSPRFGARGEVSLVAWSHLSALAGSELLFDALHAVLRLYVLPGRRGSVCYAREWSTKPD